MKVGDLVRDKGDNDLGLVISEVRSYGTIDGPEGEYVMVQWSLYSSPQRLIMTALHHGWVEVVSEAKEIHREETTNR